MTVEEHIAYYSRLRGVKNIKQEIRRLTKKLGFEHEKNKLAGTLSGGNKRKL